ncbi:hypothetical protein CU098_001137, partial [Rhizopus stolonifer]
DVKIGNVRLESLKEDTLKAKRIRTDVSKLNQQTEAKMNSLNRIEDRINHLQQERIKLNDVIQQANLTRDQIQQIINKRDFFLATYNSLKDIVNDRPETTEELKEMLNNHRQSEGQMSGERNRLVEQRMKTERKLKAAQDELSTKHTQMGKLMAAKEQIEEQIQRRIEMIESINTSEGLSLPINDGQKTASLLRKHMLKSQHMSIVESKKHLVKQTENDMSQIENLKNKLLEFNVSSAEIEDAKEAVEKEKNTLEQLEASSNTVSRETLTQKERMLRELDEKITDLNDEMNKLSKLSDSSAKLSLKRTELESKKATTKRL